MSDATWTVTYIKRGETEQRTTTVRMGMDGAQFYATNLEFWGCGKMSYSPKGAIKMLVQDMATIVDMKPNI
jgi:hypothetical protein